MYIILGIATGIIGGTAVNVSGYQINSKLSRKTGVPAPTLSAQTGGMPPSNSGEVISKKVSNYKVKRKGGKRK